MRIWREAGRGVAAGLLALSSCVSAALFPQRIVDAGLHRQWLVERDSSHPERPARLVEVPWRGTDFLPRESPKEPALQRQVVSAGARVTVWWGNGDAILRLSGTALEAGRVGDVIPVRAGLHGAILRVIVRGPDLVELQRGRP
jgi:hypothetical protein